MLCSSGNIVPGDGDMKYVKGIITAAARNACCGLNVLGWIGHFAAPILSSNRYTCAVHGE